MEKFRKLVEDNGGLHPVTMGELRDEHGAAKLGTHVRARISRELRSHGLGHFPVQLPAYGHEEVRLYFLGSSIEELVMGVMEPSEQGDEALREAADPGSTRATEMLNEIRDIVCRADRDEEG